LVKTAQLLAGFDNPVRSDAVEAPDFLTELPQQFAGCVHPNLECFCRVSAVRHA
jgi:hypothetical protein